jgi:hypothetical protein
MAQAVSRRPVTAQARIRSRVSSCGICGGQILHWDRFIPRYFGFPLQFHSTDVPLHGKTKKKLIIFIIELHNKPQGCDASVASAAGPFTKKYFDYMQNSQMQTVFVQEFLWGQSYRKTQKNINDTA